MAKNRMIAKSCPKCDLQVAVASKACKCGYSFFHARKSIQSKAIESDERRRTARIRREKPNYYDSQEFEKKKRRTRNKSTSSSIAEPIEKVPSKKETTATRAKRRRQRKEEEDGGGDLVSKLSTDKQALAAIILTEINRKLGMVVWQPA